MELNFQLYRLQSPVSSESLKVLLRAVLLEVPELAPSKQEKRQPPVIKKTAYLRQTNVQLTPFFPSTQNVSKCTHIEIFTASSCMFSWLQKIYNSLLAGSCTLHSRKFPTSHRYTPTIACLGCFVGFGISQVQACIEVSIFYIATIALINSV